MESAWRGPPWRVANGHISLYKRLVDDGQAESVLAVDPWSNQSGSADRWTFRQATCEPLLRTKDGTRSDAFATRFYAPINPQPGPAGTPSVGFAPSMSGQTAP